MYPDACCLCAGDKGSAWKRATVQSSFSDNSEGAIESPPLARRSFFRVQEVEFSWARNGVALLVLVSPQKDATNQSYYGEALSTSMRYRWRTGLQGKATTSHIFGIHLHDNERYTANTEHCGCFQQYQVPLDKEGPVHEAAWSPNSEELSHGLWFHAGESDDIQRLEM